MKRLNACAVAWIWPVWLLLGSAGAAAQLSVELKQAEKRLDVRVEEQVFTSYLFGEEQKYPYFFPVNGPGTGRSVTTETSQPYPHHHSLFFGCDRVNGGNYWQESNIAGQILSQGPRLLKAQGESVQFIDECLWKRPGKDPVLRDVRTVTVTAPSEIVRCIDVEIVLHPLVDVSIEKTNHSLFSGRMVKELSCEEGGVLVNAQGDQGEKGTFGVPSPWCDYYGERDGITEGMAILEHPDNPWFPTPWFTRDYGFFSPTPMYWPQGDRTELPRAKPVRLRYRVVVHVGDTEDAKIAALYEEYSGIPAALSMERLLFEKALKTTLSYRYGESRKSLLALGKILQNAHGNEKLLSALERLMIEALSEEGSREGKQFLCRKLSEMGSAKAVPVLKELLNEEGTFDMACFALERIPGRTASDALASSLSRLDGPRRIGVIQSLGRRRERGTASMLASFASGDQAQLARAAVVSLGRLGTEDALDILMEVQRTDDRLGTLEKARLTCAYQLLREGRAEVKAQACFEELMELSADPSIRWGALSGLIYGENEKSLHYFLRSVKEEDERMAARFARLSKQFKGIESVSMICDTLPDLPVSVALPIVEGFGTHEDDERRRVERDAVRGLLARKSPEIRVAAAHALGRLGEASDVPRLLPWVGQMDAEGQAVREGLSRMTGAGVEEALLEALKAGDESIQVGMIRVLQSRGERDCMSSLMELTRTGSPSVQKEASKALSALARGEDLDALLDFMISSEEDRVRKGLEAALLAVCRDPSSQEANKAKILGAMEQSQPDVKTVLLPVLGKLGGGKVLVAILSELDSKEDSLRKAAIQALAAWEDPSPMQDLLRVARRDKEKVHRVLALRGFIQQVGMPSKRAPTESVDLLRDAMKLAKGVEEKRAILSVLPQFACEQAIQFARAAAQDEEVSREAKLALRRMVFEGKVCFDFQLKGSALEEGAIEVNKGTLFSGNAKYGWDVACLDERDRKIGTPLTRDFVFDSKARTFRVKLPNGNYLVRVLLGDMSCMHDEMEVLAEEKLFLRGITHQAGTVEAHDIEVEVRDGLLDLTFRDGGGSDSNWTCAGVCVDQRQ